jgi:hypothetical protein
VFLASIISIGLAVQPLTIPASGVSMKDPPAEHRHTTTADPHLPNADDPFDWLSTQASRVPMPEEDFDDAREFWESVEQESEPIRPRRKRYSIPAPGRHPYVFVRGYPQRFYVPLPILRKHQLAPGETIAPDLARKIAIELGAKYTKEELEQLRKIDEESPK